NAAIDVGEGAAAIALDVAKRVGDADLGSVRSARPASEERGDQLLERAGDGAVIAPPRGMDLATGAKCDIDAMVWLVEAGGDRLNLCRFPVTGGTLNKSRHLA